MKKSTLLLTAVLALTISAPAFAGQWQQNANGWWYQNDDGSYPKSAWAWLDGNKDGAYECYCFNADGYLYTSTITPDSYAVGADGAWADHNVTVSRHFFGSVPPVTAIASFANASSGSSSSGDTPAAADGSIVSSKTGSFTLGKPAKKSSSKSASTSRSSGNTGYAGSGSSGNTGSAGSGSSDKTEPTAVNKTNKEKDSSGPSGQVKDNKSDESPQSDSWNSNITSPGQSRGMVYWRDGSATYHKDPTCSVLGADDDDDDVSSGTLLEAERNGVTKPCSKCAD